MIFFITSVRQSSCWISSYETPTNYSPFMQLLAKRERFFVIYSIIHFQKICIVWIGLQRISFWLLWTSYCANETSWCLTVVAKLYTRLRTYFIIRETFQTYSLPVYPFLIHYLRLHALNDKSFISRFLTPILKNNKNSIVQFQYL